jgi:hypothetical protein
MRALRYRPLVISYDALVICRAKITCQRLRLVFSGDIVDSVHNLDPEVSPLSGSIKQTGRTCALRAIAPFERSWRHLRLLQYRQSQNQKSRSTMYMRRQQICFGVRMRFTYASGPLCTLARSSVVDQNTIDDFFLPSFLLLFLLFFEV